MTSGEARILRLHAEPCVFYPEAVVHEALMAGILPFMEALEHLYLEWLHDPGIVGQPPKQVYARPDVRGDWRVMPCSVAGGPARERGHDGSIDAVKVIGTNEEERVVSDKISVGKALLLHPADHHVEAIFDVAALSSFRTAAISLLAAKACGCEPAACAGIVGAGRVGYYTAAILREWMGAGRILVHDVKGDRGRLLAEVVAERFGGSVRAAGLEETCRESRALFLATSSPAPVVDARLGRDVPFISSVGADADNLSEIAIDLLPGRTLVSESQQNIAFGDLRRWHAAGLIRPSDIRLLTDVVGAAGRGAEPPAPVLFISTGTAVQDALVCRFLHDRLAGRGGIALAERGPQG
jgi:ornithine cyclodeaminase/alanine dehydrogenase-like protein (mu-crystallin family)